MEKEKLDMLAQLLLDPMQALWMEIGGIIPNLLAATVMLVVGYLLAKTVGFVVRKTLSKLGVDNLADRLQIHRALESMNVTRKSSELFASLASLFILVAFFLSAVETLGFDRLTSSVDHLLIFLPKLLSAALVLMMGLFVADVVRTAIRNAASSVGIEYAPAMAKFAFGLTVVLTIMLAINQLDVDITLLNEILGIALVSMGVAVAISLGLGSRDLARQVVSGVYVRDLYRAGDVIEVNGKRGTLIEVGTVKSQIQLVDESIISIANQTLLEQEVTTHQEK